MRQPVKMSLLLSIAIAVLVFQAAGAEAKEPTVPVSFVEQVMDVSLLDEIVMPVVDVDALRAEDARNAAVGGIPHRVAEPERSHITVTSAGTIEQLDDGSRLWRVRVTSKGAEFLSFSFSDFRLPRGAKLYFYSVEHDFQIGPYTARRNNDLDVFASPAIPGDSAVIELFLPAGRQSWPTFVIDEVSHGYRDFLGFSRVAGRGGRELPLAKFPGCMVNTICAEGIGWESDKDAVARIFTGTYVCTGTMIASQRQDCTNYFLTARHCVDKRRTAQMLTFYWNAESKQCGGLVGCPWDHTSSGSTLRATYRGSDFTLVELSSDPDPSYHVYYAGFSRSSDPPSAGTCIGHPQGFSKKISHEYDPIEEGNDPRAGMGDSHWRVVAWDVGDTEPGSSGSALWNPSHEIVGQLTGGDGECGGWSAFGKLSLSWANGLAAYLDPDDTGVMSVGGYYATSACYPGCGSDTECDDSNECTDDVCNAGACENSPVGELTVCADGVCCGGICTQHECSVDDPCPEMGFCHDVECVNPGTCAAACLYTEHPEGTSCGTNAHGECCSGWCMPLPQCDVKDDCESDGDLCTRVECVTEYKEDCETRYCIHTFDPTLDPSCAVCVPTHDKEKGPRCSDGIDNDCDGLIDGADPDC